MILKIRVEETVGSISKVVEVEANTNGGMDSICYEDLADMINQITDGPPKPEEK